MTVLAVIVGLFVTSALVTASLWPVMNEVRTGTTPEYPDLQPRYFSTDAARVFDESRAAVEALHRWRLTGSDAESKTIYAERTSALGFVDEIMIEVVPETAFVTRVDMRSRSRTGKGDFGQNARNVREFQAELDDRLGAVRFVPPTPETQDGTPK